MTRTTTPDELAALAAEFTMPAQHPEWESRVSDGAAFVLDADLSVRPVWGEGERVAWASGEPMMIAGPTGVGKTTLCQQVVLSLLGIRGDILGLPTRPVDGNVLYLACDRPMQIARSLRRMVAEEDRDRLSTGLKVWRGPLPFSIVDEPHKLAEFCEYHESGAVIADSLKDLAPGLAKDEIGALLNIAFQEVVARGIELGALHHNRKPDASVGAKPSTINDVYGSTWITAGMGSVLSVWGTEAGTTVVEVDHLKQPVDHIGNGARMTVTHDHTRGISVVSERPSVLTILRAGPSQMTVQDVACLYHQEDKPSRGQKEAIRRQLQQLVEQGKAHETPGQTGGKGGGKPTTYTATEDRLQELPV